MVEGRIKWYRKKKVMVLSKWKMAKKFFFTALESKIMATSGYKRMIVSLSRQKKPIEALRHLMSNQYHSVVVKSKMISVSKLDGLLPKSLFALSEAFFDNSKSRYPAGSPRFICKKAL